MAVYSIVSEVQRDIGPKTPIFHSPSPFNLLNHLEPLEFLSKISTQTARFPKPGRNDAEKFKPLEYRCTNVADDRRQTRDRRQTEM